MLDFPLTCPSYSQLSRRLQGLNIKTPLYQKQHNTQIENNDVVALTIDSTGLKRFGRDEWHQEKHKVSSKRSWRKMHIGSDHSHYIRAAVMTDKNTKDEAVVGDICDQISVPVGQVFADKAYDENTVYDTLDSHFPDADIVIPPKKNLLYDEQRDHRVRSRAMIEIAAKGQMAWQKKHEYGKCAHGELAMQRYKRTFGNQLHSRSFNNQKMEMMIACGVLNSFTEMGMPQSYRCA